MRSTLPFVLATLLVLAPMATGQTFVFGTQAAQNTTTTYPTPYGNWYSGMRGQYLYQAQELVMAGMVPGNITFIGFPVVTAGTPDLTPLAGSDGYLDAFEIKMGLTSTMDLSAGWDTPGVVPLTTVYGPDNQWQDVPGWNYHLLPAPFFWDGTSNILIEICHWNGPVSYGYNAIVYNSPTPFVSALTYREDSNPSCGGTQLAAQFDSIRPDTAFGYGLPPVSEFQTNSPASSLDINGIPGSTITAAQAYVAVGSQNSLNLSSTNVGMPFELALAAPDLLVALSAGGIATPGSQTVNINVASPGFLFLFGGAWNIPFPGNVSLPFSIPAPTMASAQMVVVDPTNLDGVALSGGADLLVVGCQPQQNFDNLALGNNAPIGWINGSLGTSPWTVHTGTTSSTATGPLTGAYSPANYMYCETSVTANTQFIMDTCPIDVTSLSFFTLNFRLSRLGATIGTLNIYQDDGTGFGASPIATYTGPEPTGMDWTQETLSFVPAGPFVAFRFDYTMGSTFTGDIAIDDFNVQ